MLRLLLPISSSLRVIRIINTDRSRVGQCSPCPCDRLHSCSHWRCDSDCVRIVACTTLDTIAWRKEGVKALDEVWVASKELGDAIYNTWGVNSGKISQ